MAQPNNFTLQFSHGVSYDTTQGFKTTLSHWWLDREPNQTFECMFLRRAQGSWFQRCECVSVLAAFVPTLSQTTVVWRLATEDRRCRDGQSSSDQDLEWRVFGFDAARSWCALDLRTEVKGLLVRSAPVKHLMPIIMVLSPVSSRNQRCLRVWQRLRKRARSVHMVRKNTK